MSLIDRFFSMFRGNNGADSRNLATTTDPFKIHTAVRIDGMTFSTDLKTFYLIDSGKLISFPLDTPSGLVIGSVFGRLTFAAQVRSNLTESERNVSPPPLLAEDTQSLAAAAEERLVLPLTGANWSTQFFPEEGVLAAMGATDIDAFLKGEVKDPEKIRPKLGLVPTSRTVKISNTGTELVITGQNISTSGFNVEV